MPIYKKAIEEQCVTPEIIRQRHALSAEQRVVEAATFCRPFKEAQSSYIKRDNETVFDNPQGAYIVLGTDNMGDRGHGYGGHGNTGCAKIDLVVGRASYKACDGSWVDPLPFLDAARVYISQKADIDTYFGLVPGKVGNHYTRSAVAIKADGVRLIGREGIKIVTGIGSLQDTKNSQGGDYTRRGIDLIALNQDGLDAHGKPRLQPLVKGDNLTEALGQLADYLQTTIELFCAFTKVTLEQNAAIMAHPHVTAFFGTPTSPSPPLAPQTQMTTKQLVGDFMEDLVKSKFNIEGFRNNFLRVNGSSYVNSEHNNTN